MIYILFIGIDLLIRVYNQNVILDNSMQELSLYKIKKEDREITIWIRFQNQFIVRKNSEQQIPFAIINKQLNQGQIMLAYRFDKQLDIIMNIPRLQLSEKLISFINQNSQTWTKIQLFNEQEVKQVLINDEKLLFSQSKNLMLNLSGNLITWQNVTFTLKAYKGNQEYIKQDIFYLIYDPIVSLNRQIIMNYKDQIQIEMFLRQKNVNQNVVLLIRDSQYDYQMGYGYSTVSVQIKSEFQLDTKQFNNINHDQWFKYSIEFEINKTITQINTLQGEFKWIYENINAPTIYSPHYFGMIVYFQSRFTEIDNIITTNKLNTTKNIVNCFPGCKKCMRMECLECEPNLNLHNQCSCDQNQFYDRQMQRCQYVFQQQGFIQNEKLVVTCQLYEYFNHQKQKCMNCPKIDEYLCTDCVYNTESWILNKTCSFQEILSNIFLNYLIRDLNQDTIQYYIFFNQDYSQVLDQQCDFLSENSQILCRQYEWEAEISNNCDLGQYSKLLKKCIMKKGTYSKFKQFLMCQQGYLQMNNQCKKCPLNCEICEFKFNRIQCRITKEDFYIIPNKDLIKSCRGDNKQCENELQIQELKQELQRNCLLMFNQICLYCDQYYILDKNLECVLGEKLIQIFNFQYFPTQFSKLSLNQLMQIVVNQVNIIQQSTLSQINFYGRQYENIKLKGIIDQKYSKFCQKYLSFNKTIKCIQYESNFTQIYDNRNIYYCPNQKCTYNLTLYITIYISNIQKVLYNNNSYNDIQELLAYVRISLYLSEISIVADVYVFDSFDQKCQDQQIFLIQDQFKNQIYENTLLKLILIFRYVSQFPDCWRQQFYSNFQFIEIRNLETNNQLLVQFYSTEVKFIDCIFLNNQQLVLVASKILFQNTSFLDSYVNNTLIEIFHKDIIQEVQFLSCNFININIDGQQIFINIKSNVSKIVIKNLTVHQVQIFNSSFFYFEYFHEVQLQYIEIIEIDSFLALIFSSSQNQFLKQVTINFDNLFLVNSSLWQSVFYEIDHVVELQNLQIINCKFYDSIILNVNDRVIINKVLFKELVLDKSQIFLLRAIIQNITLNDVQIIDSFFNSTSSFITIEAHLIILEKVFIANCTYSPPTNILDIKATLGKIQALTLMNFTYYYQLNIMLPNYFLNLEIYSLKIIQAYFFHMKIDSVKLLYIQSDVAEIKDLNLQILSLAGGSLNEIIRISSINRFSTLKIENLQLTNIYVRWMQQSQLIYISGNGGTHFINNIIISKIKSISENQIFYCSRNNLQISNVKAQFQNYIGFLNQQQSIISVKNYQQEDDPILKDQWFRIPIFKNIDDKSIFEGLTIENSLFINSLQPIIGFMRDKLALIIVRNVQISYYSGTENIFEFLAPNILPNLFKNIYQIELLNINILNTQINDIEKQLKYRKLFLKCQLCRVVLNQIYFINLNIIILDHYRGRFASINNIFVYNSSLKDQSYFILTNILKLIKIKNVHVTKLIGIFNMFKIQFTNIQYDKKFVIIENFYINQCDECLNIIKIYQETYLIQYKFSNLFIKYSNFSSDLFQIDSTTTIKNQIRIRFLLIHNTKLYQLICNLQQYIQWHFDRLILVNVVFTRETIQGQFFNSYLSNTTFNGLQLAIVNQSLVLNQNQRLFSQPISISFKEQFVFQSSQVKEDVYQVYFHKNQTLAYVPSGTPISKFIYINPITNQQETPYGNFIIVLNLFTNISIQCSLNQFIDGLQGNYSNMNEFTLKNGINIVDDFTFYMNPYQNYTYIQNDLTCNNITLRFNIRTLPCQLGEYLYLNQCLTCEISKNYYSVTYKAQFCNLRNDYKIEELKIGNIKLRSGFWRAQQDSHQIEKCQNELCQGGWNWGDQSCLQGYTGALCKECDIYNLRGQGKYAEYDDSCQICNVNFQIILKGILLSLWLMLLGFLSYNSNKQITQQYLVYKITRRNVAEILMRQSTNQISVIFKIFTNYIFYLYLLKDKLDFINYQFTVSLDFISNPSTQLKPQLDCLLVEYHNLEIHYLQFIFSIISPFYTLTLLYLIYLILLKFKVIKFQFNLILITIYSVYLFNQQLIFQNQMQLLSYTTASNIEWINLNKQFKFHTKQHHHIIFQFIIPSTFLLFLIPVIILFILKTVNKQSIKSTKYFGVLFTEYKSDQYYWEIVRIYQKYLIIGCLFQFNSDFIFYFVQTYLALMLIYQPYALKNLNQLEQKSLYILNSSLINILIFINYSNFLRAFVFVMLNFILIYDIMEKLFQKVLIQNRNFIIKLQVVLIQKMPQFKRWININKSIKLKNNLDILRNYYQKQKISSKTLKINLNKVNTLANFERLETEIEMMEIKK